MSSRDAMLASQKLMDKITGKMEIYNAWKILQISVQNIDDDFTLKPKWKHHKDSREMQIQILK